MWSANWEKLNMDTSEDPSPVICTFCGETFTLTDETDRNLPLLLLCGHVYCTLCLRSIEHGGAIKCPTCEVESTLPEGGVDDLQKDNTIIGLICAAEMNKIERLPNDGPSKDKNEDMVEATHVDKVERTVADALSQATENLAQLKHIHETVSTELAQKVTKERVRLETEIKQVADVALHSIQKWRDLQLDQLTEVEEQFSTSKAQVSRVEEKMKSLESAMQVAREICRVPLLEQYCSLDKVLETLQAPVDEQSPDMYCITVESTISYILQSEDVKHNLTLALMRVDNSSKHVYKSPQSSASRINRPWRHKEDINGKDNPPLSQLGNPDVTIEEVLDETQEEALPPTGPELATNTWGSHQIQRGGESNRNDTQWVVVIHIMNPGYFYVRYLGQERENENLAKKISDLSCSDDCFYTSTDTVQTESMVLVKWKFLWCRANVLEVMQTGCEGKVEACPVTQLDSIRVFFMDSGLIRHIYIQSFFQTSTKSLLRSVNSQLRKVSGSAEELHEFPPQAVRCSLKDLVPYDPKRGWSRAARVEFQRVTGHDAVEMRTLGRDKYSLLVDLRIAAMDQASNAPISVRDYLVLVQVARFHSPVPLSKTLLYSPPACPKINTELRAVVSHINSPADFYLQVDNAEFVSVSAKLQECYNADTGDLGVSCLAVGEPCVACYDAVWYRAVMIGQEGSNKVEVHFVDFGNKEVVPVSSLRQVKDLFFALPSMATRCCLSEVIPVDGAKWSHTCTDRLISLAHQKEVTVVATGMVPVSEPVPVKLFQTGVDGTLVNLAELLVKEQLARFREGVKSKPASPAGEDSAIWDPPLESNSVESNSLEQNAFEQAGEPLAPQYELRLPAYRKDLKVRVSHVNSPSSFYVQFTQDDSHLKRMHEQVKEQCGSLEPQDVDWKADMYCAAQIDVVWERGRICSDVTSSHIAEVMRCDHGGTVKLHISKLRPLPSSLMGSLALECTLTGIRPAGGVSTWTATACDLFSSYLAGASTTVTIQEQTDERPVPVALFCSNNSGQFVSMADFLASQGLALKERKPRCCDSKTDRNILASAPSVSHSTGLIPSAVPPKPAPRTIMSAEKVATPLYLPPELPSLGHIKLNVCAVGENGLIYVRTPDTECQLELLSDRIKQSMKTLPSPKSYTWKSVQGCVVIGPDMLWYRGQLLEVLKEHVKVQYVDYGLTESIPVVHVYPRLLCDDVPHLCVPCQLHGVTPVGGKWQSEAVSLMRTVLLNCCVDMEVVELPSDPRGPLTAEIFLDGMSLSRILCHHKHASMDKSVPGQERTVICLPPLLDEWDIDTEALRSTVEPVLGPFINPNLPQEGERIQVIVKHLCTPNELFLWPLQGTSEVEGETLEEALTTVNENISSLPGLVHFSPGSPCLAEYNDGKYYRARVVKVTSVEPVMVLVQHVDFGSYDTLPTSKLCQIPAKMLQFPTQTLKVKVGGFKAPSVSTEEAVLSYSPAWSLKAAVDMIDLLHGDITASVVSKEPELTVLLYNSDGDLVHLPLVHSGLAELE